MASALTPCASNVSQIIKMANEKSNPLTRGKSNKSQKQLKLKFLFHSLRRRECLQSFSKTSQRALQLMSQMQLSLSFLARHKLKKLKENKY